MYYAQILYYPVKLDINCDTSPNNAMSNYALTGWKSREVHLNQTHHSILDFSRPVSIGDSSVVKLGPKVPLLGTRGFNLSCQVCRPCAICALALVMLALVLCWFFVGPSGFFLSSTCLLW